VYLESEKCVLFLGGKVDRCEEGDAQDGGRAEKMGGRMYRRKRAEVERGHPTDRGKNQKADNGHTGAELVKYCSTDNELGDVAGRSSSLFVKFWCFSGV